MPILLRDYKGVIFLFVLLALFAVIIVWPHSLVALLSRGVLRGGYFVLWVCTIVYVGSVLLDIFERKGSAAPALLKPKRPGRG